MKGITVDYGKTLPVTGATLTVGGMWFGWWAILAIALGVVLVAAAALRVGFRRSSSLAMPTGPDPMPARRALRRRRRFLRLGR